MAETVETKWIGGMAFETSVNGHDFIMDAASEFGGNNTGPRPKPLLLSALAGCTGMDIASLLNKMRANVKEFKLIVSAEQNEEHPKYYKKIHLIYRFFDDNPQKDKIKKAVELSQEKYCGVSFMLAKAAELTWSIEYFPAEN